MVFSKHRDCYYLFPHPVLRALDSSKKCIAVLLNLTKLTDTEIGVHLYKFSEIIFTGRQQGVKTADERIIEVGIPQGTILEPIIFLMYLDVHYVQNKIFQRKLFCCADDTAITFIEKSWGDVKKNSNRES